MDSTHLALAALVFTALHIIYLSVYRLWFSPIAAFPGPLLPRLTFWYEFYYDWVKTGKYYLRIQEMHEKYGMARSISKLSSFCIRIPTNNIQARLSAFHLMSYTLTTPISIGSFL